MSLIENNISLMFKTRYES